METDLSNPLFQSARGTEIIQDALALAAVKDGEHWYPSGTAMIIGCRLAITAKHLFDQDWWKHGEFSVIAIQKGTICPLWYVERVYPSEHSDIAVLFLSPAPGSKEAAEYKWEHAPILNMRPPSVGEAIWAFGYHGSEVSIEKTDNVISVNWRDDPSIATGEVIELHDELRDMGTLSFPCFRTNAKFEGGMSGGPVFNSNGELCGLVCYGLSRDPLEGEWVSYVVSLWPLMGTMVDLPLSGFPRGCYYPFRELAKRGLIHVLNLDDIRVELDSNHAVRVGLKKESVSDRDAEV